MSSNITYEEAKCLEGYLEKKSHGLIASWQKRYFQIIDGREIIYKGKPKDTDIKARFELSEITMPESVEKKVFKFISNQREYFIKAKSKEEKERWINAITLLKKKLIEKGEGVPKNNLTLLNTIITNKNEQYSNEDSYDYSKKDENMKSNSYNDSYMNVNSYNDSYTNPNSLANPEIDIADNLNTELNVNITPELNTNNYNVNSTDINKEETPNLEDKNKNIDDYSKQNDYSDTISNTNVNLTSNVDLNNNLYTYNYTNPIEPKIEANIENNTNIYNEPKEPTINVNIKPVPLPFPESAPVSTPVSHPPLESNFISTPASVPASVPVSVHVSVSVPVSVPVSGPFIKDEKEEKTSLELLKLKDIDKLINISDERVGVRIYHEYMFKKNKQDNSFTKKWFFICSPRPLFDQEYLEDDFDLDPKMVKQWIKFDKLMLFKFVSPYESDKNFECIDMASIDNIEKFDVENRYHLILTNQNERYEFFSYKKEIRDKWYEVLKNSSRTVKQYEVSITKCPRNIELLNTFFKKGEKEFEEKIIKEIVEVLGDYNKENCNNLDFTKMSNYIVSTLDGCNSNSPPKTDLLNAYAIFISKEFLKILKSYWDKGYEEINVYEIMDFSTMLFSLWESAYLQNIDDINYYKNGKAFANIYIKKTFQNILSVIENILEEDREGKALIDNEGKYYTNSPNDLYELLITTFDFIKTFENKYIYELTLNLFYHCIYQYLLGIGAFLINLDIIIEKEYLLAISNNCITINNLVNKLVTEVKNVNLLNDQEINESLKLDKINILLRQIKQKSIALFIYSFSNELGKFFSSGSILDLDIKKIASTAIEILEPYRKYMKSSVSNKANREILKLTIYHYINLLLKPKLEGEEEDQKINVEQLKEKIKKDIPVFQNAFEGLIGKNKTQAEIKILSDIIEFLSLLSPDMLISSCKQLRQSFGPSFDLNKVSEFLNLRTDFKEQEIEDAKEKCHAALVNYQDNKSISTNYFSVAEIEKKREKYDEKEEEKNDDDIFSREDFKYDEDEDEEEKNNNININDIVLKGEETCVIHEDYIQHKILNNWENFYMQTENGALYLYKDQNSNQLLNKIPIKNIIKIDTDKQNEFVLIENYNSGKSKEKTFKGKIYKFKCNSDEEKDKWVKVISSEIKRLRKDDNNKIFKVPPRKKEIIDHFKLEEINKDPNYMRNKVMISMNREKFFDPSQRKLEKNMKKKNDDSKKANNGDNIGNKFTKFMNWFVDTCDGVNKDLNKYFDSQVNTNNNANNNKDNKPNDNNGK